MKEIATETVMVISDTQYPFAHRDHLDFLIAVKEKYSPTRFVHIGDELDFHAMSDYSADPDGLSPGDELKAGLKDLHKLYKVFPEVSSCTSNHNARPFRRAYKYGIPTAFMRSYAEFMQAPSGWQWADKHVIDDVLYEHGLGCSGKFAHLKAALANMQSTVMGHLHANAGIEYSANPKCLVFGMATGCLVDADAYAAAYGKPLKSKPILGCGVVDKGIPTFVPMVLRKGGKWRGRL